MSSKNSKTIKQLNKKVKKLKARIKKLEREMEGPGKGEETVEEISSYSEDEVEKARELTDEAEEVLDILDKT